MVEIMGGKFGFTRSKVVICQDKEYCKFIRLVGNDYYFTKNQNKATIFDNSFRAKEAIKKYNIENFGLSFAKVSISTKDGIKKVSVDIDNRWSSDPSINTNIITRELLNQIAEPLKLDELNPEEIHNNRLKIKMDILTKIGMLIEFHQECQNLYAVSHIKNQSRKEVMDSECDGCEVCNYIQELKDELERPELSKIYKVTNMMDTERWKGIDFDNIESIASMYHDYIILRCSKYYPSQIAEMYGISFERHKELYDRLLESDWHRVIGRATKGKDKKEMRTKIDI